MNKEELEEARGNKFIFEKNDYDCLLQQEFCEVGANNSELRGKEITYEMDLKTPMICEPVSIYKEDRIYTYEDYLNWTEDEQIELIDGKIYYMSAPAKKHQELLLRLSMRFGNYLHSKSCNVYFAPFDVRIDLDLGKDSVVQPDLVVICDDEKLDEKGLNGAPDLVIEVLSKSTASKDKVIKYNKYLSVGVREYWLVDPIKEEVIVNILKGGKYEVTTYMKGDVIKPKILSDLYINVTDLFEGGKGREIVEVEAVRINTAKSLLSTGMDIEEVEKHTGLSFEVIEDVMNNLK